MFKLVTGKDGTTTFLPIDDKMGGKVSYIQNKDAICLTENQASYVYKKVILNKVYKEEDKMMQMENWSILSDNVRYVQHDEK